MKYSDIYGDSNSIRLIGTFFGCNGFIIAPNKIHVSIIQANTIMPTFQPNFTIRKSVNGAYDKAPIPVPAVTNPKRNNTIKNKNFDNTNHTIRNSSFFIEIKRYHYN
jgi:hypothetical protein